MSEKENYEKAQVDGKDGIYYEGYFFPVVSKTDIVMTLYGSETYLNRTVAYCCKKHLYMTGQIVKTKECLRKQCPRMVKTPYSEPFWEAREEKKRLKKLKKGTNSL